MSFLAFDSCTHRISAFALIVVAAASITPAQAQIARVEVHPLATQTLISAEFLTGKTEGKRETIAGELRLPRLDNDRLPAVILMHGASGVGGNVDDWSQHLNSM